MVMRVRDFYECDRYLPTMIIFCKQLQSIKLIFHRVLSVHKYNNRGDTKRKNRFVIIRSSESKVTVYGYSEVNGSVNNPNNIEYTFNYFNEEVGLV